MAVSADCKDIDGRPFHAVGEKYLTAVTEVAGCMPLIVPALVAGIDIGALAQRIDGLLLTGSPSNVHPSRYAQPAAPAAEPYDKQRDSATFALIAAVLERGIPLLGLCRGFQELNVAFGGSLHARLHEVAGRADHRRPDSADPEVQYGPRHPVRFIAGSAFARLAGTRDLQVNSLHGQGIDRLGEGLIAEGHAPDATIEAVRIESAPDFGLAVQWHPEYQAARNEFSVKLFRSFGDAVRRYAARAPG